MAAAVIDHSREQSKSDRRLDPFERWTVEWATYDEAAADAASLIPKLVRVDRNVRGTWEVVSSPGKRITCKTMEEARRIADRLAARRQPCETVILDAYHRVVHLKLNGKTQEGA